jgi:hypothetical protein
VAHIPGSTETHRGRWNNDDMVAWSQDGVVVVLLLGAPDSGDLDSGDRTRGGVAGRNGGGEWRWSG